MSHGNWMGIQTPPNLTVQQIKDIGYLILNAVWALALGHTLKLFLPLCLTCVPQPPEGLIKKSSYGIITLLLAQLEELVRE